MSFNPKDHYYHKAKKENFLARSIYKLQEIDQKYKIINKGDKIVDFGYFPGSWIQYSSSKVGPDGLVVGIDIQAVSGKLSTLENVTVFERDIFSVEDVKDLGLSDKVDVVVSDMAPNTMGVQSVDQARSLELVEKVFEILPTFLRINGNMVIKVFDGNDAQVFLKTIKRQFEKTYKLKPKSTRKISKEFFFIGVGFKGRE